MSRKMEQIAYMNHTQNDGHFHLVRIREDKSVVRSMPARIEAKGVSMIAQGCRYGSVDVCGSPSRVPDAETLRKDIVVHEARVHREQSHHEDDVTTTVSRSMITASTH